MKLSMRSIAACFWMVLDIDSFCDGLKKERRITAVVDDITGMKVVQYLRLKGIRIESIWTGCEDLPRGIESAVMQYENALENNRDKERTVLLTMDSTDWQRGMSQDCGIMDLRELSCCHRIFEFY